MKPLPLPLIILTGLLLALLAPPGVDAKGYDQSGIVGQVTGFTTPYQYVVKVFSDKGVFITQLVTEPGGAFQIGLKPGSYVLTPYLPVGAPSGPSLMGLHTHVTVVKKEFAATLLPFFLPH
jgi:hypothetical protein